MASLAFCVALAMMTSAISSIAEATDAGDWYVDLGKSEKKLEVRRRKGWRKKFTSYALGFMCFIHS